MYFNCINWSQPQNASFDRQTHFTSKRSRCKLQNTTFDVHQRWSEKAMLGSLVHGGSVPCPLERVPLLLACYMPPPRLHDPDPEPVEAEPAHKPSALS